jgi:DNA-binding PadR family transcriptional regulator
MKHRTVSPAILGALSLRPMSGYDIRKFVQQHLGYFWKESYGQIYPMLKRMQSQGLVQVRVERQSGKPNRQVYSLAAAGNKEFEKWLAERPAPPSPRNELLLKIFFGHRGRPQDAIRQVEELRSTHQRLLQEYVRVGKWLHTANAKHPGLPYWLMALDFGARFSQMQVAWSEESLRELKRLANAASNAAPNKLARKKGR